MSTLSDISNDLKPKMENCRVFYIHVGHASPNDVHKIMDDVKRDMARHFNTRNVIFVPIRDGSSGWQYPDNSL